MNIPSFDAQPFMGGEKKKKETIDFVTYQLVFLHIYYHLSFNRERNKKVPFALDKRGSVSLK